MSDDIEELKREFLEYHMRVEEVLSGMDALVVKLTNRVDELDGKVSALGLAIQASESQ